MEMRQLREFFTPNENYWFSGSGKFAGTIYKYIAYNLYHTNLYLINTYAYYTYSYGYMLKNKTLSHNPITSKVPKDIH